MFIRGEYIEMKYGYENFEKIEKTLKIVKSLNKDSDLWLKNNLIYNIFYKF